MRPPRSSMPDSPGALKSSTSVAPKTPYLSLASTENYCGTNGGGIGTCSVRNSLLNDRFFRNSRNAFAVIFSCYRSTGVTTRHSSRTSFMCCFPRLMERHERRRVSLVGTRVPQSPESRGVRVFYSSLLRTRVDHRPAGRVRPAGAGSSVRGRPIELIASPSRRQSLFSAAPLGPRRSRPTRFDPARREFRERGARLSRALRSPYLTAGGVSAGV